MKRKVIPYQPYLKEFARKLRNESTLGEILLWNEVKNKKLGFDFHRQKPLEDHIVDLYCYELDLVIEIDGIYHEHEEKYAEDAERDKKLEKYGLTILRFTEQEVRDDIINVLRTIGSYIADHEARNTPL